MASTEMDAIDYEFAVEQKSKKMLEELGDLKSQFTKDVLKDVIEELSRSDYYRDLMERCVVRNKPKILDEEQHLNDTFTKISASKAFAEKAQESETKLDKKLAEHFLHKKGLLPGKV